MDFETNATVNVGVTTFSAVQRRYYFSGRYLEVAGLQANIASGREQSSDFSVGDVPHWSAVVMSVMSAHAAIESFVNEVLTDIADGVTSGLTASVPEAARMPLAWWWTSGKLDRAAILTKVNSLRVHLGRAPMEQGSQPWQDLDTLRLLRNALVHYKPEALAMAGDEQKTKLEQRLQTLALPANPIFAGNKGNPYFPDHIISAGVAEWATKTARTVISTVSTDLCLDSIAAGVAPPT